MARYFFIMASGAKVGDREYFRKLSEVLENPATAIAVYRYYLHYDLTSEPWTEVGVSNAEKYMKEHLGKEPGHDDEMHRFALHLIEQGIAQPMSTDDLFMVYKNWPKEINDPSVGHTERNAFSNLLNGLLIKHGLPGKKLRSRNPRQQGFWKLSDKVLQSLVRQTWDPTFAAPGAEASDGNSEDERPRKRRRSALDLCAQLLRES